MFKKFFKKIFKRNKVYNSSNTFINTIIGEDTANNVKQYYDKCKHQYILKFDLYYCQLCNNFLQI